MKSIFRIILLVLMMIVLATCDKEFVTREFPSVFTLSAMPEGNEGIVFSGNMIWRNSGEIKEMGFIWQIGEDPAVKPGFKNNIGAKAKSGDFHAKISNSLKKDSTYIVRAYAVSGGIRTFGEKVEFVPVYDFPLVLNNIVPIKGFSGDTIRINGKRFNNTISLNQVEFDTLSSKILDINDTVLTCIIPHGIKSKLCTIKVITNGIEGAFNEKFTSLDYPPFGLKNFEPIIGHAGDTIRITGAKFSSTLSLNQVIFDTKSAQIIKGNDSVLLCLVPSGLQSKLCTIKVIANGLTGSFNEKFMVIDPIITYLSANKIKYGNVLSIYGMYLDQSIVCISDNSYTYYLTPYFVSSDSLKVMIYNHQNPTQLLKLSSFRVGVKAKNVMNWSDQSVSLVSSWKNVQPFPGNARYKSSAFSLNGNIYIGGGASYGAVYNDLWAYNPATDSWSRMADLPGIPRCYPRAFSNSTYGYLGAGTSTDNSSSIQLYDFYKYDPQTNSWSSIADYPDNILNSYVGFTVSANGRPFVSLSNQILSLREVSDDNWISHSTISDMIDCPAAGVFSIGNRFYLIAGYRINGSYSNAVWEYNTDSGIWTKKSDFPGPARFAPAFFSINNYGYYGCGSSTSLQQYNDMWRYDPSNDKWIRIEDFPGGIRSHLISSSTGNFGFIGLGIVRPSSMYNDFWKYDPSGQ